MSETNKTEAPYYGMMIYEDDNPNVSRYGTLELNAVPVIRRVYFPAQSLEEGLRKAKEAYEEMMRGTNRLRYPRSYWVGPSKP